MMLRYVPSLIALLLVWAPTHAAEPDILIADFEGQDYGGWQTTGTAFGTGPARGTLPGQMKVSGYEGKGLVNSFRGGDRATGTLTSPPLKIQRKFINFLVGGGGYAGETCINLCLDGKIVRTARGPNTKPGGSEELTWHSWGVADLLGQEVTIQIVDRRTGGWGHTNVDHIYQSDEKISVAPEQTRKLLVNKPYLLIPVSDAYAQKILEVVVEGKTATRVTVGLAPEAPQYWLGMDVTQWQNKTVTLHVERPGLSSKGLERIMLAEALNDEVKVLLNQTRSITVAKRYLNFPVSNSAPERLVHFSIGGKLLREFKIRLADGEPDFWVYLDLAEFRSQTAQLWVDEALRSGGGLGRVYQDDTFPGAAELYQEKLRPQFHFTSKRGWNNDTNGMMYYKGEYHLFWQHNPYGWPWGNMTWGHAVSPDLVHWTELRDALHPDQMGTIFSGSGVVDRNNTAGFQMGTEQVLVCVYTAAGGTNPWSQGQPFTQCLAYSNDRGRTWSKYAQNPVVAHINGSNRDPKVIWYEPGGYWVMVLYLDNQEMGFLTSPNLKDWTLQSKLPCFHECPELFELSVAGDAGRTRWVLYGGSGDYLLGSFDGQAFHPESEAVKFAYGNCLYASQTFNNIPAQDGRRIQMAWGQVAMPGMPFNQMILFPVNLTLRRTEEGVRLFAEPVREIEKLHQQRWQWQKQTVEPGGDPLRAIDGELFHIKAKLNVSAAQKCGLNVRGIPVTYNAGKQEIACQGKTAPLKPQGGTITLEILVDRASMEIFANEGQVYMPMGVSLVERPKTLGLFTENGPLGIEYLDVYALKSIWH